MTGETVRHDNAAVVDQRSEAPLIPFDAKEPMAEPHRTLPTAFGERSGRSYRTKPPAMICRPEEGD